MFIIRYYYIIIIFLNPYTRFRPLFSTNSVYAKFGLSFYDLQSENSLRNVQFSAYPYQPIFGGEGKTMSINTKFFCLRQWNIQTDNLN